MSRARLTLVASSVLLALGAQTPVPAVLVVCAPGYPGDTEQAQPAMDAFASGAESAVGWRSGSLAATYFETAEGGIQRMQEPDAVLALVPLAFLLEFGQRLKLEPRLQAVPKTGANEVWTLVAGKGLVKGTGSLEGWEVTGRGGYAPGFVRNVLLKGWGTLPENARVTPASRVLSALRSAARGEEIAVLLDGEQTEALPSLPFAKDLEVVFESEPLPRSLLCVIGDRLDEARAGELLKSLLQLHRKKEGVKALEEFRLARFEPVSSQVLEQVRRVWKKTSGSGS